MIAQVEPPDEPDTDLRCEIEFEVGVWREFALWALDRLVLDGIVRPTQRARYRRNGQVQYCQVRQLAGIPYRRMAEEFYGKMSRFLAATGDLGQRAETLIAEGRALRDWAPRVPVNSTNDAGDEEIADDTRASRFTAHVDFALAILWDHIGDSFRAERLCAGIVTNMPDIIGWPLWSSASHNLACLEILRGDDGGLSRLCDLIELGADKPHLTSGATDSCWSEVLRYFLNCGLGHSIVTATVERRCDSNAEWHTMYEQVAAQYRDRAKQRGLHKLSDIAVMWPAQPEPWDRTASRRGGKETSEIMLCGLKLIGAQDIQIDFVWVEQELRSEFDRHRYRISRVRELSASGMLDEARVVLNELRSAVASREEFATVASEVERESERIESLAAAQQHVGAMQEDSELFDLLDQLHTDNPLEAQMVLTQLTARLEDRGTDPGQDELAKSVSAGIEARHDEKQRATMKAALPQILDLVKQGEFNEAVLQSSKLKSEFHKNVVELVHRTEAETRFNEALGLMEQDPQRAETCFAAAVARDKRFAPLVSPLLVACTLFHAQADHPVGDAEELGQFATELKSRVDQLIKNMLHDVTSRAGVWQTVRETVEHVLSAVKPGEPLVAQIAERLVAQAEGNPANVEVLREIAKVLDLIRDKDHHQAQSASAAELAELRVEFLLEMAEGNRRLKDVSPSLHRRLQMDAAEVQDLVASAAAEASQHYQAALAVEPTANESWRLLGECRIATLPVPRRRRRELAGELNEIIKTLPGAERKRMAVADGKHGVPRPADWIDEQLQKLEAPNENMTFDE